MTLDDVYEDIRSDSAFDHLRGDGIVLVPGRGLSLNPLAFVVGDAPGALDNTLRRPFSGPEGVVLERLMDLAGFSARSKVSDGYIPNSWLTNVIKYRLPGNRTPTRKEVADAVPHLRNEYRAVDCPSIIIAVGSVARRAFDMQTAKTGQVFGHDRMFMVHMYHPSYGLQHPSVQPDIEKHWFELPQRLRDAGALP